MSQRRRILEDLPAGSLSVQHFAAIHSVGFYIMKKHITEGIDRETIEVTPFSFRSQVWRYLTPDQQRKALTFWDHHGIKYRKPAESEAMP